MQFSVGRSSNANLRTIAALGGVDLDTFMEDIAKDIHGASGDTLEITGFGRKHMRESKTRMEEMRQSFIGLKEGNNIEETKNRLIELAEHSEPHEIAAVKHKLASEGLSREDFRKLCDEHLGTEWETRDTKTEIEVLPGHPVNTYIQENDEIESIANHLKNLCNDPSMAEIQAKLDAYLNKRLADRHDEFLHGPVYIERFGYTVDESGTVPYQP